MQDLPGHKNQQGITANTSHLSSRNFGPIQESKLGVKRSRPVDLKAGKAAHEMHSMNQDDSDAGVSADSLSLGDEHDDNQQPTQSE